MRRVLVPVLAFWLVACGEDEPMMPDAGQIFPDATTTADAGADAGVDAGEALTIFDVWREMLVAVRGSPDHLPERARAIVARRDARSIFEFVRDQIATYPPEERSLRNAVAATHWGTKATLRGGAGTPREKVELLVELLREAGFEAEVRQGLLDPAIDVRSLFFREINQNFVPTASAATIARWEAVVGPLDIMGPPRRLEGNEQELAAQAEQLTQLAGAGDVPFDGTPVTMPVVRVLLAGVPLVRVIPGQEDRDLAMLDEATRDHWSRILRPFRGGEHRALVPAAGAPLAAWVVHEGGTLIGILDRGGGEGHDFEADRQLIDDAFGFAGAFDLSPGLGAWAELERTKLTILSHATEIIATGNTDGLADFIGDQICGPLTDGLFDPIPGASELGDLSDATDTALGWAGRITGEDLSLPEVDLPGVPCL